jgi:hypothetical protein
MRKMPTHDDLKRTISKGVSGTAMPAFAHHRREHEYDAVIEYIKSFSVRWKDPENFAKPITLPATEPKFLVENLRIQAGKELF